MEKSVRIVYSNSITTKNMQKLTTSKFKMISFRYETRLCCILILFRGETAVAGITENSPPMEAPQVS